MPFPSDVDIEQSEGNKFSATFKYDTENISITQYQVFKDESPPDDNPLLKQNIFIIDSEGFVHVYVDATSEGLGVWFNTDNPYNVVDKVEEPPGSRQSLSTLGKIQAATIAVQKGVSAGLTKLVLHTDCLFIVRAYINGWVGKWNRNNYIKSSGEEVKWKRYIKRLDAEVMKMRRVKWLYEKQGECEETGIPKLSEGMENADKFSRFYGPLKKYQYFKRKDKPAELSSS